MMVGFPIYFFQSESSMNESEAYMERKMFEALLPINLDRIGASDASMCDNLIEARSLAEELVGELRAAGFDINEVNKFDKNYYKLETKDQKTLTNCKNKFFETQLEALKKHVDGLRPETFSTDSDDLARIRQYMCNQYRGWAVYIEDGFDGQCEVDTFIRTLEPGQSWYLGLDVAYARL